MVDTAQVTVFLCRADGIQCDGGISYDGESNENLKSAIKIRNTARLSCKLTTMILMV